VRVDGYSMSVVEALDLSLPPSVFFSTKYTWMSRVNENLDPCFCMSVCNMELESCARCGMRRGMKSVIWGKCSMRKENVCAVWKRGKTCVTPLPLCLTCVQLSLDACLIIWMMIGMCAGHTYLLYCVCFYWLGICVSYEDLSLLYFYFLHMINDWQIGWVGCLLTGVDALECENMTLKQLQ